ncbi:type I secretion system permease/ATPase [Methylophaga lonarensis]|uniref:type I secretion system permease/ATPase n=1 Tax=Methylophaga lonarensis TaxID=999151 RepID=UPI003D279A88
MDTGLNCLVALARYYQVAAEPAQLAHHFRRGERFDDGDIILAAESLDFKARLFSLTIVELNNDFLPAIGKARDGHYFIIARVRLNDQGKPDVLIHDLRDDSPRSITVSELTHRWSGETILLTRRAKFAGKLSSVFDISWFVPSLLKYRHLFTEVIIASFFLQIFALATPIFFQVVMDKVLVHQGFTTLDVLAVGFFMIIVFEALLGGIRNYLFSHTTNRIDVELGSRLYSHLMSLPLAYFESRQVGQNVARVRELDTVREFITGTALTLVIDVFFVFVFIAVLWFYSITLTWLVLATIPLYILLSLVITPRLRARLEEKFRHGALNTAFLTESITGISTVKSMAIEPQMRRKLEDHLSSYVFAAFRAYNLNNIANQIASFINKMMILGIIWWGAHLVIAGEMTVGQLVAFNMLAGRVSGPVLKLVQLWQDFQQAGISIERLGDILNAPSESVMNQIRPSVTAFKGAIKFDKVHFKYKTSSPSVLNTFSLHCLPGEVIGIVGKSGSGKSTISKLLQRLYQPQSGRIFIDDLDLNILDSAWLRRQMGIVSQESFLFNRSIRENIALTDPGIAFEDVIKSAKLAGAHDFIVNLSHGYDTVIDEQGANLSGGQKQRIAIARALINNPRILILDEATSALDYESERVIQNNLQEICHGRTVLIIAHRLSAVRHCQRIVVVDEGRVIEEGTHGELLLANGYYKKLHDYQSDVYDADTADKTACEPMSSKVELGAG